MLTQNLWGWSRTFDEISEPLMLTLILWCWPRTSDVDSEPLMLTLNLSCWPRTSDVRTSDVYPEPLMLTLNLSCWPRTFVFSRIFVLVFVLSSFLHLQGAFHQSVLPSVLCLGPGRPHYPAGPSGGHHRQRGDHCQTSTPAHPGLHPGEKGEMPFRLVWCFVSLLP